LISLSSAEERKQRLNLNIVENLVTSGIIIFLKIDAVDTCENHCFRLPCQGSLTVTCGQTRGMLELIDTGSDELVPRK
jgi:hypothetical protein